ncbi:hypothetical protein [Staphylococcus epidermidis]
MGLRRVGGVTMGSGWGNLDAGLIGLIMEKRGKRGDEVLEIVNKE